MSEVTGGHSPARELFDKAVAAMNEERLDKVNLGGGVVTWLDEGCADVNPSTPDEVVVSLDATDDSGIASISYLRDGVITFAQDERYEPRVWAIGGPETDKFADELAQEMLPLTLSDSILEDPS